MEKKDIRKHIFALRSQHTQEWIEASSLAVCDRILSLEEYRSCSGIWAYMDCKGEVSMKKLLETSWKLGKQVAVPKVLNGETMEYYLIDGYEDVRPGYFQVPEPVTGRLARSEDSLIILPGVAFDKNRHRCGYGKGFYDRYLSAHPHHPTIAAAFDFQVLDQIPADAHDILPQKLITETTIYH